MALPKILDGAFGTYLAQQGFTLAPPLWSARALSDAPDLVVAIHSAYRQAGAEILRLASFGLRDPQACSQAHALARQAMDAGDSRAPAELWGTIAARFDCRGPSRQFELAAMMQALQACACSSIIVETQTTLSHVEDALAAAATLAISSPCLWLGVVGTDDETSPTLHDLTPWNRVGELVLQSRRCLPHLRLGIALHCTPLAALASHLRALAPILTADSQIQLGLYPHAGTSPLAPIVGPLQFGAQLATIWQNELAHSPDLAGRLHLVGACCQSTPAHIAELRRLRDRGAFCGASPAI